MFSFLTPYMLWIKIAAVALVLVATFYAGCSVTSNRLENKYNKEKIEMMKEAKAEFDAMEADYQRASAISEARKAEKEIVYETITKNVDKIITRTVYSNVCLDDGGLQLINAAASGQTPNTGKPDARMPSTK